jgi:oligosaccharide repeat unit polymerase
MLIIATTALIALSLINLYITKAILHPANIYTGSWAIQLLALGFFGQRFITPSIDTIVIVVLGATSFSVGSHLSLNYISKANRIVMPREIKEDTKLYLVFAILVTISVVGQYQIFINLLNDENIATSLIYARTLMSVDNEDIYGTYKYGSALALGVMLAVQILMTRRKATRSLKYLFYYLLLASVFMAIMSSGRGPVAFIFLQVGLVYVLGQGNKIMNWKFAVMTGGFLIFIFSLFWIMGSAMGKADDNAGRAFGNLVDYLFSSIPALSAYIDRHPIQIVGGEWGLNTFRFFLVVASKAGLVAPPASLVQDSVPVPHLTNLYTTYLQYGQDFGWTGIMAIPAMLGFIYGSLFKWTMINRQNDFAFYLLVISYLPLLQSVFQETHFSLMSSWIQFILIGLVLTQVGNKFENNENK